MKKTIYLTKNSNDDFVLNDSTEKVLTVIDKNKLIVDAKEIYENIYIPDIDHMPLEIDLENQINGSQHIDKVIFQQIKGLFEEINKMIKEEYAEK